MTYDTGTQQYRLAKMHRRMGASSTKVGNKTYARIVPLITDDGVPTYQLTITYFTTDIITCIYSVRTPSWLGSDYTYRDGARTALYLMEQVIQPMGVQINNGGYATPSTTRRINAFLANNDIRLHAYTMDSVLHIAEMAPDHTVIEDKPYFENEALFLLDDSNSNRTLHKYTQRNAPTTTFDLNNPTEYKPGWAY